MVSKLANNTCIRITSLTVQTLHEKYEFMIVPKSVQKQYVTTLYKTTPVRNISYQNLEAI